MNEKVKLDKEKERASQFCEVEKSESQTTVFALSHDGRGIATVNHKTTFISGALPSETVTYQIKRKRSHYNDADAIKIINESPDRSVPPCEHYGVCGGCSLQHMKTSLQIEFKQKALLEQLKHFGNVTPLNILPPIIAGEIGYRRKARLGVKYVIKKNKVLVGFREKKSNYLAELTHCVVLHPKIGELLPALSDLIASLLIFQHIPQVEVAIGDTDAALVFRHLEPITDEDKTKLIDFGQKYQIQIYLQPNAPHDIHKIWPYDQFERLTYTLPDLDLTFLFHPLDFTQINLEVNRLMVNRALDLLDLSDEDSVLDLFCGIGNFTLPIARKAKHVIGVEGCNEMVSRATENSQHNKISNTSFYASNLMDISTTSPWMKQTYDKALLDPPRTGAKEVLPLFKEQPIRKIVYVSCNPATLARDAGDLVNLYGYQLKQIGMMNMFPHTSHVEAMALFEI